MQLIQWDPNSTIAQIPDDFTPRSHRPGTSDVGFVSVAGPFIGVAADRRLRGNDDSNKKYFRLWPI